MRKIFLAIIGLLVFHCLNAQLVIGINSRTSYNYIKSLDKDIQVSPGALSASYGVVVDYYFTQNYAVSTGLEMIGYRGINFSVTDLVHINEFATIDISTVNPDLLIYNKGQFQYLSFPLTLKLNTVEIGYNTYFANFGLVTGFLSQAKSQITIISDGFNQTDLVDRLEEVSKLQAKRLLLCYRLGGGISYALGGSTALNLGLYYEASVGNFINLKDQEGILLRNISLSLGMMF